MARWREMVEAQYQGDSLGEADRRPPSSEDPDPSGSPHRVGQGHLAATSYFLSLHILP